MDGGPAEDAARAPDSGPAKAPDGGLAAFGTLGCSKRRTLVEGVTSAENLLFTTTNRLFVSGDEGIFEVTEGGDGGASLATRIGKQSCRFGGMVQVGSVVYANCYGDTDSELYAAELNAGTFAPIYAMPGRKLANGLTADGAGNLFVAFTVDGRIVRLVPDPADPMHITRQSELSLPADAKYPNGIKFVSPSLYFTSGGDVWEIPADSDAGAGTRVVAGKVYLDDLYVDGAAITVADIGEGALEAYDHSGELVGATPPMLLKAPSSLLPAKGRLGLGADDYVVTEKGANRVAVVHACAER